MPRQDRYGVAINLRPAMNIGGQKSVSNLRRLLKKSSSPSAGTQNLNDAIFQSRIALEASILRHCSLERALKGAAYSVICGVAVE